MSRIPLLILLSQICLCFHKDEGKSWDLSQRSKIEATFMTTVEALHHIDHNVKSLFTDYGKTNSLTLRDMSVRRISDCPTLPGVVRYEAYVMHCQEFESYLYYLKPKKYCVKMAHLDCGRMKSSMCLIVGCSDNEYRLLSNAAYNCTQ